MIFQPAPGKKSSPGTPWLRVRKSLQPEVDRMLGLVYSAVRVARDELYKNSLPGKLILSKRKGLWEVMFS